MKIKLFDAVLLGVFLVIISVTGIGDKLGQAASHGLGKLRGPEAVAAAPPVTMTTAPTTVATPEPAPPVEIPASSVPVVAPRPITTTAAKSASESALIVRGIPTCDRADPGKAAELAHVMGPVSKDEIMKIVGCA